MVDADHLRIVFSVNGIGFVMSVANLLAIRDIDEVKRNALTESSGISPRGSLPYQGTDVNVYDLAMLFDLPEEDHAEEGPLLIFSGSDCPWAVKVDHVDGVLAQECFEFHELPAYWLLGEFVPYSQIALFEGRLLVSVDAEQIDQAWLRNV